MESKSHNNLVKKIIDVAVKDLGVIKNFIESDIYEIDGSVTRTKDGFIPDFHYNYDKRVIIGEAKTMYDFEREHSKEQYKSYINTLKIYKSRGYEAVFILSVPWQVVISAYKLILKMIKDADIKFIIINELGVYKVYEKNNSEK